MRRVGALALAVLLVCAVVGFGTIASGSGRPHGVRTALHPHRVIVGIGEQRSYMFKDPRFWRTHIRYVRRTVGWDLFHKRWQTDEMTTWLHWARARRVIPLITFDHSRLTGRHRVLPRPAQFAHEFRTFRKRYPWVHDFATWNEANLCSQPTCHKIPLVVAYYKALRHICRSCHVLGAELLDQSTAPAWIHEFERRAREHVRYWGLHNYIGANRLSDLSTRRVLSATHGEIWLTETGGLVNRRNHSSVHFRQSAAHAAVVDRFLLSHSVFLSPRITRIYLYEWNAISRFDAWDSALIDPNQRARPAYRVVLNELHKRRRTLRTG